VSETGNPRLIHQFGSGSFGCHEALHMASFLAHAVEDQLCEHPAVALHPELRALADAACESLFALYQAIGARHFEVQPKPSGSVTYSVEKGADVWSFGERKP
jgi:hypothetical protein